MTERLETATLAAGCFWCVETVFKRFRGVERVVSGYAGGTVPHPTYQEVCSEATGHAEAVQITFDPETISYAELLEVFWRTHDPTTLNRQGADVGTQYRSAIFFHDEKQRQIAESSKNKVEEAGLWPATLINNFKHLEHNFLRICLKLSHDAAIPSFEGVAASFFHATKSSP